MIFTVHSFSYARTLIDQNERFLKAGASLKLLLLFALAVQSFYAQYFEFNVLEKIPYSNQKNGFFAEFLNTNSSALYVLNSNLAVSPLNKDEKLRIIAHNKSSLIEMDTLEMKGFPSNKATEKDYDSLHYFKTIVLEDYLIVFWNKLVNTDSTKTSELYVESFYSNLKRAKKLTKLFASVQQVDSRASDFSPSTLVCIGNPALDILIVGAETQNKEQEIDFSYSVLNADLSLVKNATFSLPTRAHFGTNGLSSAYELGKDGNVYIRTLITRTKDELIDLGKGAAKTYLTLSVLNPKTGAKTQLEMLGSNKTITDFSYLVTGKETKIFGFFGDLEKDPSGIDKQGVFYATIESEALKNVELKYAFFEKTSLNKLFPKSKGGRKRKGDPVKQLTDEELNTRFDIEYMTVQEDQSVLLFFTRKYNYEEMSVSSGLDGQNRYKSELYCEKNNVSAIRITPEGKITWTANTERSITYSGTDVSDVKVIQLEGKYYVVYGTEGEKENNGKKKKEKKLYSDKIEYAVFNPGSSKPKKMELVVDKNQLDIKDLVILNPRTFQVFENKIYFNKQLIRQKPLWYAVNVLCFPSIYYSVLSGNTKQAKGTIGVAVLKDGKPPKKQKSRK